MENEIIEELRKARFLVVTLAKEIDVKNERLLRMETKYDEISVALGRIMEEKDRLNKALIEGNAQVQFLKVQNIKLKHDSEIQRKEHELRVKELETRAALKELEWKNQLAEKEKSEAKKPMWSESIPSVQIEALSKELKEKVDELEYIENLNQTLILKEHNANHELQEARKKLISDFQGSLCGQTLIGIKRMGEIDMKPFRDVCLEKFSVGEWEVKSVELSSLWQEYVNNPNWHPLNREYVNGRLQEVINQEDDKLKELRSSWGEAVCKAVADALLELNEYNPSGRYPVNELWNFNMNRKASLKEGIECLINQLTSLRSNKRRR